MSIQEMEDLKQHYLDEMLSLGNDLQIKDYRNEKIDIRFRRECENMIDELKDDFSPINVYAEKSVTFSNPLFDSNDECTSSDDESLSDEDVSEDKVKIYSNPLFKFDDEYISSDVNPLFNEVLENIESKASYDSNLDEPALLVIPLSDFNKDECFDSGSDVDEIEFLLNRDPSTPKISVASILEGFTNEPPLKENDDLFDLESKANDWKKILYDAPIDDLMTEDKIFDPGIHKKKISPTYVSLYFKDRHYLSFTYVIRIFLPYFTYPVESSSLPLSSGSEDIIFDPVISDFHFSSLEPVAYEYLMEVHIEVLSVLWGNWLPIPDGSLPLSRRLSDMYLVHVGNPKQFDWRRGCGWMDKGLRLNWMDLRAWIERREMLLRFWILLPSSIKGGSITQKRHLE
ncbi:hypothetical protein Tco_1516125 [Tanacetum coccineum]